MPLPVYLILLTLEFAYMIAAPAQQIVLGKLVITNQFFAFISAKSVYLLTIGLSILIVLQTFFIVIRGRMLKGQQSRGSEKTNQKQEGSILHFLILGSGIFLTILSTILTQLLMRMLPELFICQDEYEINEGCSSSLRMIAQYFAIAGLVLLVFLIFYADLFVTKWFPDQNIPWAAWSEKGRLMRNIFKAIQVVPSIFISGSYLSLINAGSTAIAGYILYERFIKPSVYNRVVHVSMVFYESQLFTFSFFAFCVGLAGIKITMSGIAYVILIGIILGLFIFLGIDKKEQDIVSVSADEKNLRNQFYVEQYVVVMMHELEKLVINEEYGQEKHIHAIISRHMEECQNDACPCKNYEPEYDKKFTSIGGQVGSKRLTQQFSQGAGGSLGRMASSLNELKRLPYKITYKTKVEIFKKEFEIRVEKFLEQYPKSYGIKLLKSFFNHKYCDSSYKALFVQLENSITCKNFKGRIFIYHLKTQIQDEMKKSLESPLSVDINSLLRFERYKLDFERNLEDLSYLCQQFWTDLIKEEYDVKKTLDTAYSVADKIMDIKNFFAKIITINPLCIDTSSTYALAYRYILRDEATFTELVNRIQQIKNSSKLEQQREQGIRFFDSDVYALLMVNGDIKDLGRIRQANSSTRFVFGYDPRDLIGSRINKLMPGPFANIHDKFLTGFLDKGKSSFLEKNQPLAVLTKDGFLQMTLFYIKPMVSLKFGLVFSSFAKLLNKYKVADDAPDYFKLNKLCIILTDGDGNIHGMSQTCSQQLGLPPPQAKKQLSINDNQSVNIQQICHQVMQQEYEFELVKGVQMQVSTTFLNRERQFRREYPDIACKIGVYDAEVGIHKFCYREHKAEINIFVIKLQEKDKMRFTIQANDYDDSLKSKSEQLTYSEFSITTANSSVISSQMATSKFKTFKQKIQSMNKPSQIILFQRLSMITFLLLLSIAACNFAINLIQNHSFITQLEVLTNLQTLIQEVPEAAHATRELLLISNNFVQTSNDEVIEKYTTSKFTYYSDSLAKTSQEFESIQNEMKTTLKSLIQLDQHKIQVQDVQTDGDIKKMTQSIQTSLNLFSSKILKMSTYSNKTFQGVIVPNISFQWQNYTQSLNKNNQKPQINDIQQALYFIIENGLNSIVNGLKDLQGKTETDITQKSNQSAIISTILAGISIFLVLVLLPMTFPPLTHIEKISQLILMSLNRLPEQFCQNETKACMEIIMFLNEQKEGEKSTHQMIKKHTHRKQNRQLLKLPKHMKQNMYDEYGSASSIDSDSDDYDKSTLIASTRYKKDSNSHNNGEGSIASTDSASVTSSKITSLSRVKAQSNHYEQQQQSQQQRVKRNEGGNIELELAHAKTSELLDDDNEEEGAKELTEAEIKQKEKEHARKQSIRKEFRTKKLKKFGLLIITAFIIAIYYGVTCLYLNLVHSYEKLYLAEYILIGKRIQCYSNSAAYVIDSLARNSNITHNDDYDVANSFVNECFDKEEEYRQMLLDAETDYKSLDNFNMLDNELDATNLCLTLSSKKDLDYEACTQVINGILMNGLTNTLFFLLGDLQQLLLQFQSRKALFTYEEQVQLVTTLLMFDHSNKLISLHEVYLRKAFQYMREQSLDIIQKFFIKMSNYYNMLFGLFVGLLSIFQVLVLLYVVKKFSKEIVKMYHVVLMVPFSGRTQNDLNRLMMIKL